MNLSTYKKVSTMNKKGVLWHGMSSERALLALKIGGILPHSVQRFWNGGKSYLDDHPLYDTSFWAKGWCMSRELSVSKKFADYGVVFAFNKNIVSTRLKIVPYSWGGSIPNASQEIIKKEREDFVLSGGFVESESFYINKEKEIKIQIDDIRKDKFLSAKEKKIAILSLNQILKELNFSEDFRNPKGKILSLTSCFGFFISEEKPDLDDCVELEKHPLFKGYI